MGLKGSLRDFGISEILQLIGLQRRTGTLTVKTGQAQYSILISGGKIVAVEKTPELEGESLQDYLIRSRTLTPEQARYASQKAKTELKPLEAVLSDLQMVSSNDLKLFLGLRNVDLINRLFLLKDGEYEFEAGPANYHPDLAAELDTEQLLMDGYRVKDEWPSILHEVGSAQAVFHKKAGEFGVKDQLEALEDSVYRLVDGEKDATTISALARLTQFDTLKMLAELKRKGRIESKRSSVEAKAGSKLSAETVIRIAYWSVIAVAVILGLNGVRMALGDLSSASLPAFEQSWQEERVRQALEVYRLDQGSYPAKLTELVNKGFLPSRDLQFVQNSQYYVQEGGYTLTGPEPE